MDIIYKMDPMEPKGANPKTVDEIGNTKQSRISQAKNWCFTWNNYPPDAIDKLISAFGAKKLKYIIGKEVGQKGTPHLQGYIHSKTKLRWTELDLDKKIHWEKCKGTMQQNIHYCKKENNFVTNFDNVKKQPKCLSEDQLRPWQKDIIEIIKKEPDDRKIYWYWEPNGNMGKTTFAKYLSLKFDAIPIEGKKNDILYCAAEFESNLYIFDFERSMEDYISYAAMEKIKNGYYMSSKYESKPIIRDPPHMICFANFEPNTEMLSKDRWVITKII